MFYKTKQHNIIQYNAKPCITLQYNTIHLKIKQNDSKKTITIKCKTVLCFIKS